MMTYTIILGMFFPLAIYSAAENGQSADPFRAQPLYDAADNGINVLLDHAHQFLFFGAWDIPPLLREGGFRVMGSQATLDTVLMPGRKSRVRLGSGKHRPFGWWPNPEFDAVITYQVDPDAQDYLPEEIDALWKFVEDGGGLIIIGGGVYDREKIENWPINKLAKKFGAGFTDNAAIPPFSRIENDLTKPLEFPDSGRFTGLVLDDPWEVIIKGSNNIPILGRRKLGRGRIIIISHIDMIKWGKPESQKANGTFIHGLLNWVTEDRGPAGGSRNLPSEAWGGGAIYPELEAEVGNITVFYAKNQKESSLKAITDYMPDVKARIEDWLPSIPPTDRMHLILSSGGGGGWAVNAYTPKEVGIISLDQEGILSVFAHELAHTMAGPPNHKGQIAGRLPGVFSEAHAGWFQGKIEALRTGNRGGHEPNLIFEVDKDGKTFDLAKSDEVENGHHTGWKKLWWIWQKLDEKYGTTWYPRWLWVKGMRWQDEPDRRLSWDEVVEDMSIAVGEDLFPFFREIGTTLEKDGFPKAEFMGQTYELPVAEITIEPGGEARFEATWDYKSGF